MDTSKQPAPSSAGEVGDWVRRTLQLRVNGPNGDGGYLSTDPRDGDFRQVTVVDDQMIRLGRKEAFFEMVTSDEGVFEVTIKKID